MDFVNFVSDTLDIEAEPIRLVVIGVILLLAILACVFLISLSFYFFRAGKGAEGKHDTAEKKKPKKEKKEPKVKQHKESKQETAVLPVKKEEPAEIKVSAPVVKEPEAPAKTADAPAKEPVKTAPVAPTAASTQVPGPTPAPVSAPAPVPTTAPAPAAPRPSDSNLMSVTDKLLSSRGNIAAGRKKGSASGNKPKSFKEKMDSRASGRKLRKKASQLKIPKSAQETIPYLHVYADTGIFETEEGHFCKSYLLDDVNYQVAKDAEQAEMFLKYGTFLNAFDPTTRVQITFNQKNINMDEFEASTMLQLKDDDLDELRVERNDLMLSKIAEGKNNLIIEKYVTVSVAAPTYEAAKTTFARIDSEVESNIKKIGGAGATALSSAKRLEILHDIYNLGDEGMFGNNMVRDKDGNLTFAKEKFRFDIMRHMGLTTKDMIAPESFTFKSDYGMVGDKYFRALFPLKIPSFLTDNVLAELSSTECNMLISLIYEPVDGEKALQMARSQIRNIDANVAERQKKNSQSGISYELISPELKDASDEANALFSDLSRKNQKLFFMTMTIVHFADSKEELDSDTKAIQALGRKMMINIKKLNWQQENALATALPLCNNKLQTKRSLTTESASVFMPFVNQELNDRDGGMYYGINAVSRNLIRHNRRNAKNGNGFILGTPGSGKSMIAKQEMEEVLISSDDIVVVIDPEGEYYPMAEMLGGEVIRIATGGDVHINPFDINMNYDSDDDPISIKSDFIVSLCEAVAGDRYGLNPAQRSLIDRCVKKVYQPFLNSLDPATGEYDHSKVPTMKDFYDELRKQNGYDPQQLADGLEIYVTGSLNVFAHPTNVRYDNRFVVYDIKDIGTNMKSMGLLVVLDNIWNRIMEGRKEGRNVWFYIDEIYLLFKTQTSADFLRSLYKRARKYGGLPTGITQNVSDLLENDIARTMLSNSDFIIMMNQAPLDRAALGELLNISATQLSYITNSAPGEGLLYDGTHIVPFINRIPENTKQYLAMTTKLSEVQEREAQKEAQAAEKSATAS